MLNGLLKSLTESTVVNYAKQNATEDNKWRKCSLGFLVIVVSIQSLLFHLIAMHMKDT